MTTDSSGHYLFSNLAPGVYRVSTTPATLPDGITTPTYDLDGTGTPNTATLTTVSGVNRSDVNFGYVGGPGSLGSTVWLDANGDGMQQGNEPGIPGVTVTATWLGFSGILGAPDNVTYTTTTDNMGHYSFTSLPLGKFQVSTSTGTLPANVHETYDLDGLGSPNTTAATLTAAAPSQLAANFGYMGNASVGSLVWYDVNGNGTQDNNEPGIAGAAVTLDTAGPDGVLGNGDDLVFTTTTDSMGHYLFTGVPVYSTSGPGDAMKVTVVPPAQYVTQTYDADGVGTPNASSFMLVANTSNLVQNFGYRGALSQGWAISCSRTPTATACRIRASRASTASRSSCTTRRASISWRRRRRRVVASISSLV